LIALREIALRRTADQVNRVAVQNSEQAKTSGSYANEHILVCLSPAPSNAKVIRNAARMAVHSTVPLQRYSWKHQRSPIKSKNH
jgi:two-component system, OmpR family, sensor histidine kinase KdpD